jgi:hypothetical protein
LFFGGRDLPFPPCLVTMARGEMPEWLNGAVSKTVERVLRSGGSNPPLSAIFVKTGGDVAQLGEHLVRNEGVGGSNPLISTISSYTEIVLDGEVAVPCSRNPL